MFSVYLEQGFMLVVLLSGLPLLAASLAGLVVSVLQTATQIQEQSIVYAVKFAVVSALLTLLSGWYARELVGFMNQLLRDLAFLGRI